VKRTLTDEQIQMFRHSEVHALLRKRQLEQDEAEYEDRARKLSVDEAESAGVGTRREELVRNEQNAADERGLGYDAHAQYQGPGRRRSSGGKKRGYRETQNEPEQTLDYEDAEQDLAPATAPKPRPTNPRAPFPGRKIISYED
jgi:hypothetical protein